MHAGFVHPGLVLLEDAANARAAAKQVGKPDEDKEHDQRSKSGGDEAARRERIGRIEKERIDGQREDERAPANPLPQFSHRMPPCTASAHYLGVQCGNSTGTGKPLNLAVKAPQPRPAPRRHGRWRARRRRPASACSRRCFSCTAHLSLTTIVAVSDQREGIDMKLACRTSLAAVMLCAAPNLFAARAADVSATPVAPDWAEPGSATHVQVAPPPDFHRPSTNSMRRSAFSRVSPI